MQSNFKNPMYHAWKASISGNQPNRKGKISGSFSGIPRDPSVSSTLNSRVFFLTGEEIEDVPPFYYNWFINDILIDTTTTRSWQTPLLANGNNLISYSITSLGETSSRSTPLNIPILLIPPAPVILNVSPDISNTIFLISLVPQFSYEIDLYNFYIDGNLVNSSLSTQYLSNTLSFGVHLITATSTNVTGTSPFSNSWQITSGTVPLTPLNVLVTPNVLDNFNQTFTVSCDVITNYDTIQYNYYVDGNLLLTSNNNSELLGPLSFGSHNIQMSATNIIGESSLTSDINITSGVVPPAPSNIIFTPTDIYYTSFTIECDEITGYDVIQYQFYFDNVLTQISNVPVFNFGPVSFGNHVIYLLASNIIGVSPSSDIFSGPAGTVPPTPLNALVTPNVLDAFNQTFSVSCDVITNYDTIQYNYYVDGNLLLTSSNNSELLGPLSFGSHNIQMSATNIIGESSLTSDINVTSGVVPPVPANLSVIPDITNVSFTVSCNVITNYDTIQYNYYVDGNLLLTSNNNSELLGPLSEGIRGIQMSATNIVGSSLFTAAINVTASGDITSPVISFNDPDFAASIGPISNLNKTVTYNAPAAQPVLSTCTNTPLLIGNKVKFALTLAGSDLGAIGIGITNANINVTSPSIPPMVMANSYFFYFPSGGIFYGSLSAANITGSALSLSLNDTISIQRISNDTLRFLKNGVIMFVMVSATFSTNLYITFLKSSNSYSPPTSFTIV